MKKLSSEKIFKATLATAIATGAFVAAAPVYTEAAPTFSDVTQKTSHYDAIMNYTAKNMISGFPDGTFRQGQAITRQDAAKLLALVLELDLDNVKDPGFKDVSKTNPNYKYIAALVEAGIISGYEDKTFKPTDNLSRAQMAKILVLGFEFGDAGFINLPFKDINERQWHIEFVRTLYTNKITTGTTSTTFSPNALVTRGQMVAFVLRSEAAAVPKQSELDKASVEAAAIKLTGGAVTVSLGNSATDANKLAAVQTYVTSQITEKDVKATVAASATAGNYVVTLTKGEAKVDKMITMTFNNAADDRFVTEVTALNAKQVAVKFATPVTKSSVLNSSNEVQNISFTMVSGATVNPGQLKGSLSDDGKTLTITANWIFDGEYAFKSTNAIQSVAGGKFDDYTAIIKANDKVAPRIVSGSAVAKVSTNTFAIFFDEPVSAAGVIAYVDNGVATVSSNPSNPNRLDITSNKNVAAGATAIIKMLNVKDFNQNLLAPNPSEAAITVSADTVAPIVTKVNILGENKVEVIYDKNMNVASFAGKARLVYSNKSLNLTATAGANANTVILTGTGIPSANIYTAVLFIDADVKDIVGNSTALYSSNVTLSKDTTPPVMTSVEYRDGKMIVTFTEDIALGRLNTVTVIDKKTGAPRQITLTNTNRVIADNTLVISEYLVDGAYQLHLPANTVTDKAGTPNPNAIDIQAFDVQNDLSSDTTRPVVSSIKSVTSANKDFQTVTYVVTDYDSGVNLESVQQIENYTWDGNSLPYGSHVTTNASSAGKVTAVTVTIHIPATAIPVTKQAAFTVNNIRDNARNTIASAAVENITLLGY
ncbi:S-layer homology domain-containing protein [Sporosarcina sp. YIM B06819]|uniref:S-layer homology domain-containing protein n=1 Tax=Sporosarcina sp. YIM B06819 TaxID=3081769 RepID=UPI00298C5120|nr:S-layer homology domain-containing protein [Sporosarcina sp. YIM B06819]